MKTIFFKVAIAIGSLFLLWYFSLYFSGSRTPFKVIESRIQTNRCALNDVSWVLKSLYLYTGPKGDSLYFADGQIEKPETNYWLVDTSRNTCVKTSLEGSKKELRQVIPTEGRLHPFTDPPFFSRNHIINRTEYESGINAQWCFQGIRLIRPIYYISFMGGGSHWGTSNSYIGSFTLEVYRGKERLFVIGNSVYGATWGPSMVGDYLSYEGDSRVLMFNDRYNEPGIIYWAHLDE